MKIFLSYAREQARIAQSISIRLLDDGHKSFFDLTTLPVGRSYDAKIRDAIRGADLFIFLISPESIRENSYARTELGIAQDRWPNPSRRVLPVMVEPTPMAEIPPYLTAVTIMRSAGNLEADVLAKVAKIAGSRTRRRLGACVTLGVIGIAVILFAWSVRTPAAACRLNAQIRSEAENTVLLGLMIDVTYGGATNTYLISQDASVAIDVGPFKKGDDRWTIALRGLDGSVIGTEVLDGCLGTAQLRRIRETYDLIVGPRS
jgi:hypothetical protein